MCVWLMFHSLIYLMIRFGDFSILAWNVRGFTNKRSHTHMRKLLTRYQPDLVFLFETHVRIESSGQFWQRIGYGAIGVEEVQGHEGGVWILSHKGI